MAVWSMTVQSMPLPWTAHPLDHPLPGPPKISLFFPSSAQIFAVVFPVLESVSLNLGGVFAECMFGSLGRPSRQARTRWPRELQICILQGPGASNTINIPRGESKRGKSSEIVERERKTKREFLGRPPIWAPHPSCPGGWTYVVPRRSLTMSHVSESNHCKLMISSSRRRASSRPNMAGSSSAGAAVKV